MSDGERPDADLLDAWRDGDTRSGDELLRRHFVSVYRFFDANLRSTHAGSDAQDLTQKTFEACIAGRDRVRSDFRAYLFGTARRQLMREWERRRSRGEVVSPSQAGIRDVRTSPSAAVARLDVQQLFLRSLQLLPIEFKAALELFYWEDRSIPEIAEELGVARGTVKSRLFRGKAMLKDHFIALGIPTELRESTVQLIEQRSEELNLGEDSSDVPNDVPHR